MAKGETRVLRVGVSACLLGEPVRYDGGHKRDAVLTDVLARHVEWVPECPEVELGLGVPRPPIDLVDVDGAIRLIVATSGEDLTDTMRAYAAWRAKGLTSLALDGYVLKSKSPSCGRGRGLFAAALAEAMPQLPMEDEARLARASVRRRLPARRDAARRSAVADPEPRAATRRELPGGAGLPGAAGDPSVRGHGPAHVEGSFGGGFA